MKSDNHYEAAFDAYLRKRGVAVVPVVEARRSYLDAEEVKSPDFIVVGSNAAKLVVDVKGRKFAGADRSGRPRHVWQNWCDREDVVGLVRWAERLGDGFRGVLAFVYDLPPHVELPRGTPDQFVFRGRAYLLRGVAVGDYRARMRTRSPRWRTVYLAADDFRAVVKPISHFLAPPPAVKSTAGSAGGAES
ncbi:MAG: HYExAFE family protein [Planctomycetes bacterium]|nr:HYExAFE family protein [Planctomycetota bacterium]